jgi:hypothetical protein
MNGKQMADTARTKRLTLKILFITDYAENGAISNGPLDPGMHVMSKPSPWRSWRAAFARSSKGADPVVAEGQCLQLGARRT